LLDVLESKRNSRRAGVNQAELDAPPPPKLPTLRIFKTPSPRGETKRANVGARIRARARADLNCAGNPIWLSRMFASTETDLLLGSVLYAESGAAEYLVESRLGLGGTAVAYLVQRVAPGGRSPAVVKVIRPEIVERHGETAATAFLKEVVALGRLNERSPPTPFVLRLFDVGRVTLPWRGGHIELPWMAIEYVSGGVEGTTLRERVLRSTELTGFAFDRTRASRALRHITEGLEEVHAVGVIHRDLTPGNVLCCNAGDEEMFKLSDFGIARPIGVDATFGMLVVGTPGYMAPEQVSENKSSLRSDVFSLACLTYFILTGEEYIPANNAMETLTLTARRERPSLVHASALCPELRADLQACALLDDWFARATARDPLERPSSAQLFAAVVQPSLHEEPGTGSERYLSLLGTQHAASLPNMDWVVRHAPGDSVVVHSAGWDGDGQCLAVTDAGVRYWNGSAWARVDLETLGAQVAPRFVRRVGAGRWLGGGSTLFEYSRKGVSRIVRGKHSGLVFLDASGSLDDLCVVMAREADGPPVLLGLSGGRWLRALPLPMAATVNALCQIDDERWLVVGRETGGRGFALLYSPLEWSAEPLSVPATRAYIACAARRERDVSLAVGTDGTVLRWERGTSSATQIEGGPDLVCAAIDVLDREWVGGIGGLWASAGGANWARVWTDSSWLRPIISIHADVNSVLAMAADGAVLEFRPSRSSISGGGWP
jgi:serine/threonine protein kinase